MRNTQLAMVIDSSLCIDCRACMVACKVANNVPEGYWRNWIKRQEPNLDTPDKFGKTGSVHFQPGSCMHCENPTCVQACPTGATYKDTRDGTVKVNDKLCIGCGSCIPACPYGARYRHPGKKITDKCDFCEDRRQWGELPACVETCPMKARNFGDIKDPTSKVARLLKSHKTVRVVNRTTDTGPNIYYISKTAPVDWPVKAEAPTPIRFWRSVSPFLLNFITVKALLILILTVRMLVPRSEMCAFGPRRERDDDDRMDAAVSQLDALLSAQKQR